MSHDTDHTARNWALGIAATITAAAIIGAFAYWNASSERMSRMEERLSGIEEKQPTERMFTASEALAWRGELVSMINKNSDQITDVKRFMSEMLVSQGRIETSLQYIQKAIDELQDDSQ